MTSPGRGNGATKIATIYQKFQYFFEIISQYFCIRTPTIFKIPFQQSFRTPHSMLAKYLYTLLQNFLKKTSNWCHEEQINYAFSFYCSEVNIWYWVSQMGAGCYKISDKEWQRGEEVQNSCFFGDVILEWSIMLY